MAANANNSSAPGLKRNGYGHGSDALKPRRRGSSEEGDHVTIAVNVPDQHYAYHESFSHDISEQPPGENLKHEGTEITISSIGKWLKSRILYELYVTGGDVWVIITPAKPGRHSPVFTLTAIVVWTLLFVAMAMQYDEYKAVYSPETLACIDSQLSGGAAVYGPKALLRWVTPKSATWCYEEGGSFDANFLIKWGARWDLNMKNQPQRWLTSALVHVSFLHLFSNAALFLVLSFQMEMHHGAWRIAIIWLIAALGGSLLSAVVEDSCTVVAGASGGIYGLVGAFVAETFLNWKSIRRTADISSFNFNNRRKLFRMLMIAAFIIMFGITAALEGHGTSQMSHVGGLMFGALLALAVLPDSLPPGWKLAAKLFGVVSVAIITAILLSYFYVIVFPSICCGCDTSRRTLPLSA